ncbi:biopolymer transporter ExbD [Anabaenopsis tanganyikae CS-531]|uniref:Biopolymer transporter ExbD n=2 Tax=Anabaenopsis TaxID=110103 RepID=A0ABT6KHP8_9CYAN|nr:MULTISPECIES: biopolymer transporter ExbD [Anabaenopsis]MDB9538816.1 biopolymer transporter ExbD [Anabaenopsis arnoldii]MDH6091093.1 biopolymer transporter ExbD [Anabaenopsis arnoldii]MDH6107427.1 biopolymer transporter ExbD [Anabaenopsis tanganyikae CS-531]
MRLQDEPDLPAQINIVPMIDVIFAILTFFIMSTLFLTRSQSLPVNLPQAATANQQSAPLTITISIDSQGVVSLDRQPVPLNSLGERIGTLVEGKSEPMVIINADQKVEHGQVIAIMDQVRRVKGVKLAIATQKP